MACYCFVVVAGAAAAAADFVFGVSQNAKSHLFSFVFNTHGAQQVYSLFDLCMRYGSAAALLRLPALLPLPAPASNY